MQVERSVELVNLKTLVELAQVYKDKGVFKKAISKFEVISEISKQSNNVELYLSSVNDLLRMYAERKDFEKIKDLKERIQDEALKEGFNLTPKVYYTLGVCSVYKRQLESGLSYFNKSLKISLEQNRKEDMCYAIMGLAITYNQMGKHTEALQELYNLKVFFEVMPLPELKIRSMILNGYILCKMGKHDEALDLLWSCYDLLKIEKNHYLYLHLLYVIGVTYVGSQDMELARLYLMLAKRSIDPDNFASLSDDIDQRLKDIGVEPGEEFDLIFNLEGNFIQEKKRGRVEFKNQFILMELLQMFMKSPGMVFSKENIVRKIWGQDYSPSIHDNKIYVTIKRLRKLIEPDYDKPKYIF